MLMGPQRIQLLSRLAARTAPGRAATSVAFLHASDFVAKAEKSLNVPRRDVQADYPVAQVDDKQLVNISSRLVRVTPKSCAEAVGSMASS